MSEIGKKTMFWIRRVSRQNLKVHLELVILAGPVLALPSSRLLPNVSEPQLRRACYE
jgi:hypothetical protein